MYHSYYEILTRKRACLAPQLKLGSGMVSNTDRSRLVKVFALICEHPVSMFAAHACQ